MASVQNVTVNSTSQRVDPTSILQHINCGQEEPTPNTLANVINKAFLLPMCDFTPLTSNSPAVIDHDCSLIVTEESTFSKLAALNPTKASGPDGIPSWLLKENADILARPVASILNSSFCEARLPQSWKKANIIPIPKHNPVQDVNKHLRPISLTAILSKVAEDYVVEGFLKPAVLKKVDPQQFGTVPRSNTTHALISMLHSWTVLLMGMT